MRRFLVFVVVVFVFAACESAQVGPTTTTSSTTTTIENDTCARVVADTVSFLDDLLDRLDETRLAEIRDRGAWPDDLRVLERAGADLDIRVAALRCDPEQTRQRALDQVNLAPGGPLSEGLLGVLLAPPASSTTTTEPAVSTTPESVVPNTGGNDTTSATPSGG